MEKEKEKIFEKKSSKIRKKMILKAMIYPKFWAHSKENSNQESPRS